MYSKIVAAKSSFPEKCYSNDEFIKKYNVDSTSEWIVQMTGIEKRYFVQDHEEFEKIVINSASIANDYEIDAIIVATSTHYHFPGLSQILHKHLKCSEKTRTIDINAACNGFMQALSLADDFIKFHNMKNILVVGADAMSLILDMQERSTSCLFGDGAGAVIVQADQNYGIKAWSHLTISENYEALTAKKNIKMNGRAVFESSLKNFEKVICQVLEKENVEKNEIDLFILHQANFRIFQKLAKDMDLNLDKIPFLAGEFGNISAATIPVCLSKLDFLNKKIILAGFGAGFTTSATLLS